MIDDRPIRDLASTQHGLVTTAQTIELGLTRSQRARLVDGVRWERLTPRVLRLVGAPPTREQRVLGAVLTVGSDAALVGASAAAWWDIPGNLVEPFHVGRRRGTARRPAGQTLRHDPVLLPPEHVVTLDGVPCVVPARALFDVAGSRRQGAEQPAWVDRIARMVDTAWAKRLVSGRTLHAMLDELAGRGRPGIQVMRQVLEHRGIDYVPPASGVESRFQQLLAQAGEPPLRRQVDTGDDERWIGRVDFRDEVLPVVVEVQSERFHSSFIDRQLDAERIQALEAAGFIVVEVTDVDVWHRPQEVVAKVRDARRRAAVLPAPRLRASA